MGDLLKVSAPSTPPTSVDSGGTVLTLAILAAASAFVRVGAALVSGFTGITSFVYVSPSGNDTTGARNSLALPCLTIAQALTLSSAGDTIFLAPGTYTETLTWLEGRSLQGSGRLASIIAGTLTLTAGATATDNNLTFASVRVTGDVALNFNAKTAGTSKVYATDCYFGDSFTMTKRSGGGDELRMDGCTVVDRLTSTEVATVRLFNCYADDLRIAQSGGSEVAHVVGCVGSIVVVSGEAGKVFMSGCQYRDGSLNIRPALWETTGCDFLGSSISVGTGTWYEYGCTFEQANISGGSGNKRVSFQRIGSTVCAGGGNTTTITLPVPLGATTYHVSATPFSANAAPPQWCVLNKTGTTFDVKVFSADDETFEFGVFYRKA